MTEQNAQLEGDISDEAPLRTILFGSPVHH
jgi:hypothetical protein